LAEFCHEKGVKHVLDHMGDSPDFVDSGIGEPLHAERIRSYPGNRRRHLAGNQACPGQKNILAIRLLRPDACDLCLKIHMDLETDL
jgi:hypothetical protein